MIEWIHGKLASAARLSETESWKIFSARDLPKYKEVLSDERPQSPIQIGVLLQLRHLVSKNSVRQWCSFELIAFAIVLLMLLSIFIVTLVNFSESWTRLLILPAVFWFSWNVTTLIEWLFVKPKLISEKRLIQFRFSFLRVPNVVWQLDLFNKEAFGYLFLLIGLFIGSIIGFLNGGQWLVPAILALWLKLIISFSPFNSGAGHYLMSQLMGVKNAMFLQDHIFLSIFLPARKTLEAKIPMHAWIWAGLSIIYLIGGLISFELFASILSGYSQIELLLVNNALYLSGFGVSIWMFATLIHYVFSHALLKRSIGTEEINPKKTELEKWKNESALLAHFANFKELTWKWYYVPAGTLLVEQGQNDRSMYWIASGEASVYCLDKKQNITQYATLFAGSSFGEITFLQGGQRSADVYFSKAGVVAKLERDLANDLFDKDPQLEFKLKSFVRASQVMDNSPMFHDLPSIQKEIWLKSAQIITAKLGECIIAEGSDENWMGMIIDGDSLIVNRSGALVASLVSGTVFGEMSAWTNLPRSANIVAKGDLMYLRWEADFWKEQARQCNLEKYLDQLVSSRLLVDIKGTSNNSFLAKSVTTFS